MRKPRKLKPGASYHVFSKANRGEMIFNYPAVKEMFMEVVRRAKTKYRFEIKNFCIMGNHYHFIMKPLGKESLSRINQWINSVFAMKFNTTFKLTGHVFSDRFKSVIIHTFLQYLITFIYVATNPVKACIVKNAAEYEYNGISFLRKGMLDILERPPNWFLRIVWQWISGGEGQLYLTAGRLNNMLD